MRNLAAYLTQLARCHLRVSTIRGYTCTERRVAWFTGPDGHTWTIDSRGDMECDTARRLKVRP